MDPQFFPYIGSKMPHLLHFEQNEISVNLQRLPGIFFYIHNFRKTQEIDLKKTSTLLILDSLLSNRAMA